MQANTSALNAGDLLIKLYDDAACTSERESFSVPAIPYAGVPQVITINKGSAMYNGIQGIAVYATVALASESFDFDIFIACKNPADFSCITLNTLVSKSSSPTESTDCWMEIVGIISQGKVLILQGYGQAITSSPGYIGVTESVPLYTRECLKPPVKGVSTDSVINNYGPASQSNRIINSAGWSSSNIPNGQTWIDGQNGYGFGINSDPSNYMTFMGFSFTRLNRGSQHSGVQSIVVMDTCTSIKGDCFWIQSSYQYVWVKYLIGAQGAGVYVTGSYLAYVYAKYIYSCYQYPVNTNCYSCTVVVSYIKNCYYGGRTFGGVSNTFIVEEISQNGILYYGTGPTIPGHQCTLYFTKSF